MQLEINENPGEQKSSQVGSETSCEVRTTEKISLMEGYDVHIASMAEYGDTGIYHHYMNLPDGFLKDIKQLSCTLTDSLVEPVTILIDIDDEVYCYVDKIFYEISKVYARMASKRKMEYHSIYDLYIEGLYLTKDGVLEVITGS